ncbi:hypothetical protein CERSUDRAFT_115157 [Gelatoporia subvermispora B]|uniref:Uncharacterized protein n=1 Tax=Ceriporiopsis subvermispora (strain B) TaxID=914234 RepID=M2RBN5_CERS8|nr:hypothetical protein CERSUDRAFT_115157 [Gelatoporia subvermispora B]
MASNVVHNKSSRSLYGILLKRFVKWSNDHGLLSAGNPEAINRQLQDNREGGAHVT